MANHKRENAENKMKNRHMFIIAPLPLPSPRDDNAKLGISKETIFLFFFYLIMVITKCNFEANNFNIQLLTRLVTQKTTTTTKMYLEEETD